MIRPLGLEGLVATRGLEPLRLALGWRSWGESQTGDLVALFITILWQQISSVHAI